MSSLEQYFDNPTKPASEYVAGELIQKSMPTNLHAELQLWLGYLLLRALGFPRNRVKTEQNVRLDEQVIRVPDLCVVQPGSPEDGLAITEPPLLCVEILSPSDRFADTEKKCRDYLRWGVGSCWILNPESKEAWVVSHEGVDLISEGTLDAESISIPIAEVFQD